MRTLSVALAALVSAAVLPLAASAQSVNVQVGTDRPATSTGVSVRERTTVTEPEERTTVRRRTTVVEEDEPEERVVVKRKVRTSKAVKKKVVRVRE